MKKYLQNVWKQQYYLKTFDGNVAHDGFIENLIDELGQQFYIKEIAFDGLGCCADVAEPGGAWFYDGSIWAGL